MICLVLLPALLSWVLSACTVFPRTPSTGGGIVSTLKPLLKKKKKNGGGEGGRNTVLHDFFFCLVFKCCHGLGDREGRVVWLPPLSLSQHHEGSRQKPLSPFGVSSLSCSSKCRSWAQLFLCLSLLVSLPFVFPSGTYTAKAARIVWEHLAFSEQSSLAARS